MSEVITAYKGFNADMTCRDFQFEVGKSYDHDGGVTVCKSGFHSCENPLDVLNYYDLCGSRFALVKASGQVSRQSDGDTKIASASLAVEVELKLPEFIDAAIKWMLARAGSNLAASGNYSKLAASGYGSKAKAGANGAIALAYNDGSRARFAVGYVGEDGIKPDTWYRADPNTGKLVECVA